MTPVSRFISESFDLKQQKDFSEVNDKGCVEEQKETPLEEWVGMALSFLRSM
jgi:hypothetical protein